MLSYLAKGTIIGISIAAPVGPIGIYCIRQTLVKGRAYGFASGLGAATADTLYSLIAALGLTFIADFFASYRLWLRLIGGLFLCFLAWQTYKASNDSDAELAEAQGLIKTYFTVLVLTLTNPMTILMFVAIFAGIGIGAVSGGYLASIWFVIGVFVGSTVWWYFLSFSIHSLKKKLDEKWLKKINHVAAGVIAAFGLFALFGL